MASSGFRLNHRGGEDVLKEAVRATIDDLTRRVGAAAGDDAEIELTTTDRAKGIVRVPAEQQARDGVLTRAAVAAGLEVRER